MNKPETIIPIAKRRLDYQPPAFTVDTVDLTFELHETDTRVTAVIKGHRQGPGSLLLEGEALELISLSLNDTALETGDYTIRKDGLDIPVVGDSFTLEVVTRTNPQANTELSGLYVSGGNFCTQCEPEGFRRITFYPDRPDVLAKFRTTIIADKARYPVLLSNGNPVEQKDLGDGRHLAVWDDPYPKPSYLFALVAGALADTRDTFTTMSGRQVDLHIYTLAQDADKTRHAMDSLKKAMAWDEQVFGLEYDLDIYNIVAVPDFNMGAMENKSLNVFNTSAVLATAETATDMNFMTVESIVAHEYFHNWTGNRVTCRDWFQLSLKEGLTVFRDQQFTADTHSAAVARIEDVRMLRARQFPEDAGPQAHPIRPDSYVEINNFYTATVYEKGAEVIRMMHTLLGPEGFCKGMDLYISRHDGTAATCDDFVAAMQDASGRNLDHFRRWYSQSGTPKLKVSGSYDENAQTFTLSVRQETAPTADQPVKQPLHIPLAVGLVGPDGGDLPLKLVGDNTGKGAASRVLDVVSADQQFVFEQVASKPVPSLLRGFSAPVQLETDLSDTDRAFLAAHDNDPFARWEAGQELLTQVLLRNIAALQKGTGLSLDAQVATMFRQTLADDSLDLSFKALALTLPGELYLAQRMNQIDVDAIHSARDHLGKALAHAFAAEWRSIYGRLQVSETYRFDGAAAGRRGLKNLALGYLMWGELEDALPLCLKQFSGADNMTDELSALTFLAHSGHADKHAALQAFYEKWRDNALTVDKWFMVQATRNAPDCVEDVKALLAHDAFTLRNPNRVRALLANFSAGNPTGFHAADGRGYALFADQMLLLDGMNPQIAARLLGAFNQWRRFDPDRQKLMQRELRRLLAKPDLSKDSIEIVSKALGSEAG